MAQFIIYTRRENIAGRVRLFSDTIHRCAVAALGLPQEKRFHRFIPMEPEFFIHPPDRSEQYTIMEISMFEGRTIETRKLLIRSLIAEFEKIGISPQDLEITIHESPRCNWGIRGLPADELALNYNVQK